MTADVRRQLEAAGVKLPAPAARVPRTAPRPPNPSPAPVAARTAPEKAKPEIPGLPRTAQQAATLGQPGVQVWSGVDGQGSVLRFFDLSPADKTALLAAAAGLGIYPVRR